MLRSGPSLWRDREPCTPTRHDERLWPLHIIYLDGHAVHGSVEVNRAIKRRAPHPAAESSASHRCQVHFPIAARAAPRPAARGARCPWDTDAVDRAVACASSVEMFRVSNENRSDKVERTWKLIKVITDHPFEELIEPCGEMFVSHEANGSIELRAGMALAALTTASTNAATLWNVRSASSSWQAQITTSQAELRAHPPTHSHRWRPQL